jgi:hypothetical protein
MRRLRAHLIAALGATFADILVGLPAPYTGPQAWMGRRDRGRLTNPAELAEAS